MAITLIRLLILYLLILGCLRLMGRRQIGELQASDLVVTILLSEIIVLPIEDNDIPILNSVAAVFLLTALEILLSAFSLKSEKIRKLFEGNPIPVILNGKLDQKALLKLRVTLDDILEALREKDIFDISKVQCAILESNGKISVQLKPDFEAVTCSDMQIQVQNDGTVFPIIYDGKIQIDNFEICNMNREKIDKILQQSGLCYKDILLLTANKNGAVSVIRKE